MLDTTQKWEYRAKAKIPVTGKNIRHLWETVVADVCDNEEHKAGYVLPSLVVYGVEI